MPRVEVKNKYDYTNMMEMFFLLWLGLCHYECESDMCEIIYRFHNINHQIIIIEQHSVIFSEHSLKIFQLHLVKMKFQYFKITKINCQFLVSGWFVIYLSFRSANLSKKTIFNDWRLWETKIDITHNLGCQYCECWEHWELWELWEHNILHIFAWEINVFSNIIITQIITKTCTK